MRIDRLTTQKIRSRAAPSAAAPASDGFSQLVEAQQEDVLQPLLQAQSLAAPAMLPQLPQTPETRDREARRHGGAMLRALGGLQLAMLGGDGAQALRTLSELAGSELAGGAPSAADPGLDQVVRAIAQRAAIELARAEMDA